MFRKLSLLYVIVIMLILASCTTYKDNGSSEISAIDSMPMATVSKTSDNATPIPEAKNQDIDQYIFYSNTEGLYRYNLDGSGQMLIVDGDVGYIGNVFNWVIYSDDKGYYKTDITGQPKISLLEEAPYFIIVKEDIYFVQNNKILNMRNDVIREIMDIPDNIKNVFEGFATDGINLYICTENGEVGSCDLYLCNIEVKTIVPVLEDIYSGSTFLIHDNEVIQEMGNSSDNQMIKQNIDTDEKTDLFSFDGVLNDMALYNDWLIYITSLVDESDHIINGYNLETGEKFSYESPGPYIYDVLSTQVNIYDPFKGLMGRLVINGEKAYVENYIG